MLNTCSRFDKITNNNVAVCVEFSGRCGFRADVLVVVLHRYMSSDFKQLNIFIVT